MGIRRRNLLPIAVLVGAAALAGCSTTIAGTAVPVGGDNSGPVAPAAGMKSVTCSNPYPTSALTNKLICDTPSLSGSKQGVAILTEGSALRFVNSGGRKNMNDPAKVGTDRICTLSFFMKDDNGNVYAAGGNDCAASVNAPGLPTELATKSGRGPAKDSDEVTTTDGVPVGKVVAILTTTNTAKLDGDNPYASLPYPNGSMFTIPVIKLTPETAKAAHATVTRIGPAVSNARGEYLAPSTNGAYVPVDVIDRIPAPLPEGEGTFGVNAISTESFDIGKPGDIGAPMLQDGALRLVMNNHTGGYSVFEIRKSLGQVPDASGLKVSSLRK